MVIHLIYQGCLRVASFNFFFFSAQLRWFTWFCLPICLFLSLYRWIYCWFLLVSFLFQLLYYLNFFFFLFTFYNFLLKFSCVHPFFCWLIIFMIIILKYSSGSLLISKQSLLIYLSYEISFWSFIWNVFLCILLFPDSLLFSCIR